MKIRHFYLSLSTDDYLIPNPPGSEFPYSTGTIVSDFNFHSDFMTLFIEKHLRKLKFEVDGFNTIMIRGRTTPSQSLVLKEHFKSLNIEIPFDEKRYKELYPCENDYPLTGLLKPVENEEAFNDFLFEMILEGLAKAKEQNAPIPCDFLLETATHFKSIGYKNEWVHKKRVFKEYGIKASLCCTITCNYFLLELVLEKNKTEIYKKEILRTLPSGTHYKYEFKDMIVEDGLLKVTKDMGDDSILFSLDLNSF